MDIMDLQGTQQKPVPEDSGATPRLEGTLEIEGVGAFAIFLTQARTQRTWFLCDTGVYNPEPNKKKNDYIVAIVRIKNTGSMEGYGQTYLLTRMLDALGAATYRAVNSQQVESGFFTKCHCEERDLFLHTVLFVGGRSYYSIEMNYEGFRLNMTHTNTAAPVKVSMKLETILDAKTKAAVIINLGVKTAASLFRRMGDRLEWYKSKQYVLIDTPEKFRAMMMEYLGAVQRAANKNRTVITGIDTETTGLNMLNLSDTNEYRDSIVSIPFAWEDNKAFLICTDMYYFSNVSDEEVYPLFNMLFRRNPDYTFQDIEFDYQGAHYRFNRVNITTAGFNTIFDQMAFATHGVDLFFDEDVRQLYFNLNPDLQQGAEGEAEWGSFRISNSLKMQTRRQMGHETLELEELFGRGNEDKFRYLQDSELALLYGGADADYTRLNLKIAKAMTQRNLYLQYRKYDMTTAYQMGKAAWNGLPIDTEAVRRLGDLVEQDLHTLQEVIYHYAWLANRESLEVKSQKLESLLGVDSVPELEALSQREQVFRYPFTPKNHKKLLFDLLGYPVFKRSAKDGTPSLDKFVLKKLMGVKRTTPVEILKDDVPSVSDPSTPLVSKDDFNSDMYPLARVFSTYATLNKEHTSYYKPILEHDMEGHMFHNFTLARAATRRILSPGQTMKGSLKEFVVAPPGKIFMSFDASQIEYRHMASLAYIKAKANLQQSYPEDWERRLNETSIAGIHRLMHNEEADYHIETAASMTGVPQHQITKKVRKQYKSIGFGIPYGLGDRALCESLHGVVNEETMKSTKALLNDYYKKQKEIIDLLESTRDSAFVPATISPELRKYLGVGDSHVGIVRNFTGFYRLFILEKLTRQRTGRIRRQAGNCIIQGGAAELFRRMLYNFQQGACKAQIQDKVQWVMTVHDELDAVVDGDIDICLLIKVIYENCTLRYPDHIPYYVGINFGANWGEAKDDANELPVIMVQRLIAAYDAGKFSIPSDGNQAVYLLQLKRHYMCDRLEEELHKLIPNLGPGHQWTDEELARVDNDFSNYVVRAYFDVFTGKGSTLRQRVEDWQKAREEYGFGVSFLHEKFVARGTEMEIDMDAELDLSLDLLEDDLSLEASVQEQNSWFGEETMFDTKASEDDILGSLEEREDATFRYSWNDGDEEENFTFNESATNPYELYVMKNHVRTKVLKVQEGVYSVVTTGTPYHGNEGEIKQQIAKRFGPGSDTLLIVGPSVKKVKDVAASEEDLDWLDKLLSGVT